MGLSSRFRVKGLRDNALDRLAIQARPSPRAWSVLLDSGETKEGEPSAPKANGPTMHLELDGDLVVGLTFRRSEDDASPIDKAMGSGPTSGPSEQLTGLFRC